MLKDAKADDAVLRLKSYETLGKLSSGDATKIIIPAELSSIASFGTVLSETIKKDK